MNQIIDSYIERGLVSDRPWYQSLNCGNCALFTGEECDGIEREGEERYSDSMACDEFEDRE